MNIQIALITFSIVALVALFFSIKKYLDVKYLKVLFIELFRIIFTVIFVSFTILNSNHKFINSLFRVVIMLVLFALFMSIFQVFKNIYNKELSLEKK